MVLVAVTGHPLRLPDTVYTVLVAGLTTMLLLLAPELQVKVLTPVAVSVALCPEQMVEEFTEMAGPEPTVTVAVVALPAQPALLVPLTL